MTISELIERLELLRAIHGDVHVVYWDGSVFSALHGSQPEPRFIDGQVEL